MEYLKNVSLSRDIVCTNKTVGRVKLELHIMLRLHKLKTLAVARTMKLRSFKTCLIPLKYKTYKIRFILM